MNKNVNVFIAVLLCALLCGGVIWLRMASEEKLGWNIQDTYSASPAYSSGASYSDATFVGPSSGGMMSVTSSRRSMRTRATSSYAGAYSSAATQPLTSHLSPLTSHLSPLTSNLSPLTSSPTGGGLYTTSSQTFKSFGGGNNAGVSMSGGSLVATNNYAQNSSAVSISSPISYTSLSRNNSANFQDALANGLSPEAVIASSMAMPTNGQLFGSYYTNDFGSSIDSYNPDSYSGIGYSGINNRQNAGDGMSSPYESWLRWMEKFGWKFGVANGENNWNFDNDNAWNAFLAWYLATYGVAYDPNNSITPPEFTYEEWLKWFTSNGGTHSSDKGWIFNFVPVGSVIPLLFMVLVYVIVIFIKKNKITQL